MGFIEFIPADVVLNIPHILTARERPQRIMSSMKTTRPVVDGVSSFSLEPYTLKFAGLYEYTPTLCDFIPSPPSSKQLWALLWARWVVSLNSQPGERFKQWKISHHSIDTAFTPVYTMTFELFRDIKWYTHG